MTDEVARVSFAATVSNGNYGSEKAEVTLNVPADASPEDVSVVLAMARRLVFDELRHSPSRVVRQQLEHATPTPVSVTDNPDEDLEELPY